MNALEKIFINKPIVSTVNTLGNENLGFKKVRTTRYAKGYGCAVEMSKFNAALDKIQIIVAYAGEDGKVTKIDYFAEEC